MIIKERDAQRRTIHTLEEMARQTADPVRRNGCLSAAARLRNDPPQEQACRLLDETFGAAADWAVLHDLRSPPMRCFRCCGNLAGACGRSSAFLGTL